MNKAYVISTATALALGYSAGFATDNLTAKAAKPLERLARVEISLGAGAANTFESFLNGQMCPAYNDEFGVESCTVATYKNDGKPICEQWDSEAGVWKVYSEKLHTGTWTPGEPE